MRAFIQLSILGALTLIGSAATLLIQGGWQAAAAAFAIFNGAGFTLTFVAIGVASERPGPLHPRLAQKREGPRRVTVESAALHRSEASARPPAPSRPRTA
jgi:hypothetical protein